MVHRRRAAVLRLDIAAAVSSTARDLGPQGHTGHRADHRCERQAGAFPTIWLLTDRASAHTAARIQMLAVALGIRFLWLPKQAPELNAMDQLWRELKRLIAAIRQAASADALASNAAGWVLELTPQQARRKAGMTSPHFWLRNLVQDFWLPT